VKVRGIFFREKAGIITLIEKINKGQVLCLSARFLPLLGKLESDGLAGLEGGEGSGD